MLLYSVCRYFVRLQCILLCNNGWQWWRGRGGGSSPIAIISKWGWTYQIGKGAHVNRISCSCSRVVLILFPYYIRFVNAVCYLTILDFLFQFNAPHIHQQSCDSPIQFFLSLSSISIYIPTIKSRDVSSIPYSKSVELISLPALGNWSNATINLNDVLGRISLCYVNAFLCLVNIIIWYIDS